MLTASGIAESRQRLAEIAEILGMARQMYEECGKVFKEMVATSLARDRLDAFLKAVYPLTESEKHSGKRPEKWRQIDQLLEEREDLRLPKVRDTLWAAYNAVTAFDDYRPTRTPEDARARLNRVWFGSGAHTKVAALNEARKLMSL